VRLQQDVERLFLQAGKGRQIEVVGIDLGHAPLPRAVNRGEPEQAVADHRAAGQVAVLLAVEFRVGVQRAALQRRVGRERTVPPEVESGSITPRCPE
jgi:hypothetical protein